MLDKREKILSAINARDYNRLERVLSAAQDFDCSTIRITERKNNGAREYFPLFQGVMRMHDGTQVFDKILLHLSKVKGVNALEEFTNQRGESSNFLKMYLERNGAKELDDALLNFLSSLNDYQKMELRSGRSSWNTQLVNSVARICSLEACEKLGALLMDFPVWAPTLGEVIGSRFAKTDKARTFRSGEGNNWLHYCAIYPNLAKKLVLEVAYPDTLIPDDVLKALVNEENSDGIVPLRLALASSGGSSFKYLQKLKDLGANPSLATYQKKDEFSFHSSCPMLFHFQVYALFGRAKEAFSLLLGGRGIDLKEAANVAIESGNAELLENILSFTPIQDVKIGGGSNLLHYACGAGFKSVEVVECLLEHSKTAGLVNAANERGETPLFCAMLNYSNERGEKKDKFKQVISFLIKYGADEKRQNRESKDCFEHLTGNELLEIRALITEVQAEGAIAGPLSCYAKDVKKGTIDPNALFVKPDGKSETMLNMSLRDWPKNKALFQILIASDKLNVEAVGSDGIKSLELAVQLENEYAIVSLSKKRAKPDFICSPDVQMLLNLVAKLLPYAPPHLLEQLTSTAAVQSESNPNVAVSSSTAAAALASTSTSLGGKQCRNIGVAKTL